MLDAAGGPTFREFMSEGRVETMSNTRLCVEMVKRLLMQSVYTLPALGLALIEKWPSTYAPKHCAAMVAKGAALKQRLIRALGADGVIIFPGHPTAAPVHGMPIFRIINFAYTSLWNVTENPVTSVPCGVDDQGLPVGVQIIGSPGMDRLTIAVAQVIEAGNGGWLPPALACATGSE